MGIIKISTVAGPIYEATFPEIEQLKQIINNIKMEKKYKLIKEISLPGNPRSHAKYGQSFFNMKKDEIKTIGEWTSIFPWLIGETIANLPEWFELVEEKEFTRSDMIAFARKMKDYRCTCDGNWGDINLNWWIKNNKS